MSTLLQSASVLDGSLSRQGLYSDLAKWVQVAEATTAKIEQDGPSTPFSWVLVGKFRNGIIATQVRAFPKDAVVVGIHQEDTPLYMARAFYQTGVYVGEVTNPASSQIQKAMLVHNGKLVEVDVYEVLVQTTSPDRIRFSSSFILEPKFEQTLRQMKTVILLDDSDSMKEEKGAPAPWINVNHAVLNIAWMLRQYGGKGSDIHLLNDDSNILEDQKDHDRIDTFLKRVRPEGTTLIGQRLQALSNDYLSNPTEESPVSIIVITDGQDRGSGSTALAQVIIDIAKTLSQRNLPRFGVGIQLVQIGNDARVTTALRNLDDKLAKKNKVWDIVDTIEYNPKLLQGTQAHLEMMIKILMGALFNSLDKDQTVSDSWQK